MEGEILTNISPVDGRYYYITNDLEEYFSEFGYIKYRIYVECKWLIYFVSNILENKEIKKNIEKDKKEILNIYNKFSIEDAQRVKEIENKTNHDVKAIEYYIDEKLEEKGLKKYVPYVHFACTSEDVNNLAQGLMIKDYINDKLKLSMNELINTVLNLAEDTKDIPMLSHTHGQNATPTTVGRELSVFVYRWKRIKEKIDNIELTGKFGGAVGNYATHVVSFPNIDWINVADDFVTKLGLKYNPYTTQIESHDTLCELLSYIKIFNNITLDYNNDMWLYICLKYFKQKVVATETGSSVMPHKVNPINHENSMANIHICNSIIDGVIDNIQVSRMQRDLSDSSTLRNLGNIFAYQLISITQTIKGTLKMDVNKEVIEKELENAPEVLAEAIQTILRKNGYDNAYETLKKLTRGKKVSLEDIHEFVNNLDIDKKDKDMLLSLTPKKYVGLSIKQVENLEKLFG